MLPLGDKQNNLEGVKIIVPYEDISDVELEDYNSPRIPPGESGLPPGESGILPLKVSHFRTSKNETGIRRTICTCIFNFCFDLIRKNEIITVVSPNFGKCHYFGNWISSHLRYRFQY